MDVQVRNTKALKPRYDGVPLRYEDTKPSITQAFTHKNIIGMGQKVHLQWEKSADIEKECAVSTAKEEVWEQAEHAKKVAVEQCKEAAQKELEKAIKNLNISHEKAIKEEAKRVEGEMAKKAVEQVKAEKEAGEKILRETVVNVKAIKEKEKEEAVAKARDEERKIAADEAARIAKIVEEREAETAKKAAKEKADALEALETNKNDERVKAVLLTQRQEKRIAQDELAKVRKEHAQEVATLQAKITEWENINQQTWKEVEKEQEEKENWIKEFNKLRESYQKFIDGTTGFTGGQADFLID